MTSIFWKSEKYPISETEHGWQTSRVIATRYSSKTMGFNIGFKFPQNPNDCDRAELSDYMRLHGGYIYSSGGSSGAEMFVSFKEARDVESANVKIKELLSSLSQLIEDLGDGVKVKIPRPVGKKVFPDTDPPDKTDRNWEFNSNINVNGIQYKKAEVSPGAWQWAVNEEAEKRASEFEARKWQLWHALNTRIITDDELREANGYGTYLNVRPMVSYSAEEKSNELTRAFLVQQMLRSAKP